MAVATKTLRYLYPAVALSQTGIEVAMEEYAEMSGGAPASTLLVGTADTWRAYELLYKLQHKLLIVPVPGLPRWAWALVGGDGIVVSEA